MRRDSKVWHNTFRRALSREDVHRRVYSTWLRYTFAAVTCLRDRHVFTALTYLRGRHVTWHINNENEEISYVTKVEAPVMHRCVVRAYAGMLPRVPQAWVMCVNNGEKKTKITLFFASFTITCLCVECIEVAQKTHTSNRLPYRKTKTSPNDVPTSRKCSLIGPVKRCHIWVGEIENGCLIYKRRYTHHVTTEYCFRIQENSRIGWLYFKSDSSILSPRRRALQWYSSYTA